LLRTCLLVFLLEAAQLSQMTSTYSGISIQVPIFEILHKYDGERVHDDIKLGRRRYKFMRLPRFLAMHMKRFAKNNFYVRTLLLVCMICSRMLRSQLLAETVLTTVASSSWHMVVAFLVLDIRPFPSLSPIFATLSAGREEPDHRQLPCEEPAAEGRCACAERCGACYCMTVLQHT
jgi:hypothetical protein